jgi:hypothetical protein
MRRVWFALIIVLLIVIYRNRRDLIYDLNYVLNTLDETIQRVLNGYVKARY